ncbi:sensor domain-containing diguanylate cyclase [Thalassolituus sp. LLYu03]|uniref:sensor domain-containing diguanylate cyclase n=1 Tax=Thalassolituus sp. LLYu03 TaxID=3421656 RepID=UPI003D26BAC3
MQIPPLPAHEAERIQTLHALKLLDTKSEERFDRVTRLARRLFDVPIALVSLVDTDRQWFKSCYGLTSRNAPRETSMCGHAILGDELFDVPDAQADPRFADNPLVTGLPHLRFYAGYPLKARNGMKMGTLCILDTEPRTLNDDERQLLQDLGAMVEDEMISHNSATTDPLTGISNRLGFEQLACRTLALCQRHDWPAVMLFMDLDGFKALNDKSGHAAGDTLLQEFAQLLLRNFRDTDSVGRMGGDEFAVFMPNCDSEKVLAIMQRLEAGLRTLNAAHPGWNVGVSWGKAHLLHQPTSILGLLHEADQAMYTVKRAKRAS